MRTRPELSRQPDIRKSPDGRFNHAVLGVPYSRWRDPYHLLLTVSWPKFLILIGLLYLFSNTLFAGAYLWGGNGIEHARDGSFLDAFFFSVQTMATVGYGNFAPRTFYAHVLVTVEALVGLLGIAMVTGLMFSRFSRPTAKVLFSRFAVIAPHNRLPTLMFRVANLRHNQILSAQINVHLLKDETTAEGRHFRRICDLKLLRSRTPSFSLSWQVMHEIDQNSPLFGETLETLIDTEATILITLTGIDETVSQTVHARHTFNATELLWDMQLEDIISMTPKGQRVIDYTRFHQVVPLSVTN
jgi:inward rectifier potassium channel